MDVSAKLQISQSLGTDLNRGLLARALTGRGVRPVRQVAIDGVWPVLAVRPGPAVR